MLHYQEASIQCDDGQVGVALQKKKKEIYPLACLLFAITTRKKPGDCHTREMRLLFIHIYFKKQYIMPSPRLCFFQGLLRSVSESPSRPGFQVVNRGA